MAKPWMIITGATGFLGGALVRQLRKEYRIFAMGRRTPAEAGIPDWPGIVWFQVDIANFDRLQEVFRRIREMGGADLLLHMASFYDFTGDDNVEYMRTNVQGTRNILTLSAPLKLRRFIFASSVAACEFPRPGDAIREDTYPNADVPYAISKRMGEEMMREFSDRIPTCIIRPAAIFSDWCEYQPLDEFLKTWCSHRWNARILGGKGQSAIPYMHVEDLMLFFIRVVERCDELRPAEILIASPDGSTTHRELYREATRCYFGAPRRAISVPPSLARVGIRMRERLGRMTGRMPFERSWMVDLIDLRLNIDASRTRRRIDWAPNSDLTVLKCMCRMLENMRRDPAEWKLRSQRRKVKAPPRDLDERMLMLQSPALDD
ncbi:MAG: NAD(P)-dependent oxidoreductase [Acidobacteriota bacterium]